MTTGEGSTAEGALVGMILREPHVLSEVLELGLTAESFADRDLSRVWNEILALEGAGRPWDQFTLASVVSDLALKIIDLVERAPLTKAVSYFAHEVLAQAWRRNAMRQVADYLSKLKRHPPFHPVDLLRAETSSLFEKLSDDPLAGSLATPEPREVADRSIVEVLEALDAKERGELRGIPTGFRALDHAIGGFKPGALYVVAGRPGMGKTTLALNFASHAAHLKKCVCYFSIEMTDTQLCLKVISETARVGGMKLAEGDLSDDENLRVTTALKDFALGSLYLNSKAGRNLDAFEAECRRLRRRKKLDMIVLDYLQQMRIMSQAFPNKHSEITEISARLKSLAMTLAVPVVALAQVNRETVKGESKKPTLANIKDSGSIEQDADAIIFIHREDYYGDDGGDRNILIVDKNRYGARGTIDVGVDLVQNRFYDLKN